MRHCTHYTILTRVLMFCSRLCTTTETWKVSFSCLAVMLTHCVGLNKSFKTLGFAICKTKLVVFCNRNRELQTNESTLSAEIVLVLII